MTTPQPRLRTEWEQSIAVHQLRARLVVFGKVPHDAQGALIHVVWRLLPVGHGEIHHERQGIGAHAEQARNLGEAVCQPAQEVEHVDS